MKIEKLFRDILSFFLVFIINATIITFIIINVTILLICYAKGIHLIPFYIILIIYLYIINIFNPIAIYIYIIRIY